MASKAPVRGTVGDDLTGGKKGRSPSKPPSLTGTGPPATPPPASAVAAVAAASPVKKAAPKAPADPMCAGIPVKLFSVIVKALGGREALEGKSTREVVAGARQLLEQARASAPAAATHFVVHAYDAPFLELVDALTEWDAAEEEREGGGRYYWLDFIACPPSKTPARDVAKAVRGVMSGVKRVLVSFHLPGQADYPLQARAWPTFEVFTALVLGVPVEVILPSSLEEVVVPELVRDFKGAAEAWAPPVEFEGKALASRGNDKIGLLRALLLDYPALEAEADAAAAAGAAGPRTPGAAHLNPPLSCTVAPPIATGVKTIDPRVTDIAVRLGHLDAVVTAFWSDWLAAMGQRALDILPQSLKYTGPLALQLAQFLHKRGDVPSAVAIARACLEYRRESAGVAHPSTLTAMGVLGQLLETQERWLEAEALLGDAVAGLGSVLGEAHPETLSLAASLGSVQCRGGAPSSREAGLELLQATAELAEEHLGGTHALTLQCKLELGRCLRRSGAADAAVALLDEVLGGRVAVTGEGHPDAAATLCELGLAQLDAGAASEGMSSVSAAVQQGLDAYLETPVPPAALTMLDGYGSALGLEGTAEDALPVLRFALFLHNRDQGPAHPASVAAAFALATCLLTLGEEAEAGAVCGEAYAALAASVDGETLRLVPGFVKPLPSYTAALRVYMVRARLLSQQAAYDDADALYRRVLVGQIETAVLPLLEAAQRGGDEAIAATCPDPERVEVLCSLARDYGKLLALRGSLDVAAEMLALAAAGHQALRGSAHLETLASLEAWASTLFRAGDFATAAKALGDCHTGSCALLGTNHALTQRRYKLLQEANDLVAAAAGPVYTAGPAVGGGSGPSVAGKVLRGLGRVGRGAGSQLAKVGRAVGGLLRALARQLSGSGSRSKSSLVDLSSSSASSSTSSLSTRRPHLQLATSAGSTPMSSASASSIYAGGSSPARSNRSLGGTPVSPSMRNPMHGSSGGGGGRGAEANNPLRLPIAGSRRGM